MSQEEKKSISLDNITIRKIKHDDNPFIATIIRSTLEEFSANKPGTVYFDETTDALYELFHSAPGSIYYIAEYDHKILGGGGIFPSPGLPNGTCELVKMYLLPQARGIGLGRAMILKCLEFAREAGYKTVYLETMPELKNALKAYEKLGFQYIDHPIGATGHFGCDLFMTKSL
jgi:putative acetyltransferase